MMTTKKYYTAADIQEWMVSKLAELLKVGTDEIDVELPLENYGLDSSRAMILVTQAEKMFGVEVSPVMLWHYPTIEALSQRLAEDCGDSAIQDTKTATPNNFTVNLQAEVVLDPRIYPASPSFQFTAFPNNIFLTGGTGFLGAFLIYELLEQTTADIYCLVRAANITAGKNKLKRI